MVRMECIAILNHLQTVRDSRVLKEVGDLDTQIYTKQIGLLYLVFK
jgi:hypothetical protein